ncbi:MAG TPA: hypoxanthine phosphoribosyltransferase [Egicoccus sp.]|nr:hypoxanthine phosphoribosyltransferase [Egicoccus sp.]HSK24754.1 hypoxanthine phosphoribosyltransferase [Egicoccus sp.]
MDDLSSIPPTSRDDVESILIPEADLQKRLAELAADVDRDYAGRDLLLVGVLKGAIFVMADLARHLTVPTAMDFMAVSSYGSSTSSSGVVRILKDLDTEIEGRDVLLVEDIVDSGLTLDYLTKNLRSRRPASVEILSLLTKPSRREVDLPVRYVGFEVPDVFVVGYGLDYAERYRSLRDIVTLKPVVYGG